MTRQRFFRPIIFFLSLLVICTVYNAQGATPGSLIPPGINCKSGSIVTVAAHMDDDILFVDPAISNALQKGKCITTVFMIGGSNGSSFNYVLGREYASRAAYAKMAQVANAWTPISINAGPSTLMAMQLNANPKVMHVYLRAPGGGVRGGYVPIAEAFDLNATISSWPFTDNSTGPTNVYNKSAIVDTLTALIDGFNATQVYALNPDTVPYIEHPDHIYSARYVREALRRTNNNIPVSYHITYQTAGAPQNIPPSTVEFKRDINATYFSFDGGYMGEGGIFNESNWDGNWIARRYFAAENGFDNKPTVNIQAAPIVNMQTQQCLTSNGLGSTPTLKKCTANPSQMWSFLPSSATTGWYGTAILQNQNGHCLANQNGTLIETTCDKFAIHQQWTPWDFGKIFTPLSSGCLDINVTNTAIISNSCASGSYASTQLWTRYTSNTANDLTLENGLVGDVIGDGSQRLVQFHRRADGPGINLWVTDFADNAQHSSKWFDTNTIPFDQNTQVTTCYQTNKLCYDKTRHLLADFDGDGKADVMSITLNSVWGTNFYFYKSTGTGFNSPVLWAQTDDIFAYDLAQQYLAGDFDGNGSIDLLIAHTRGDLGLNFWIMTNNNQTSLNQPKRWMQAINIQNSAQLMTANLNNDAYTDVLAFDNASGAVRASMFTSNGAQFSFKSKMTFDKTFVWGESKLAVAQNSTGVSDIWIMQAGNNGRGVNFFQMINNGTGLFGTALLRHTTNAFEWAESFFYPTTNGNQLIVTTRRTSNVDEVHWLVGIMNVFTLSIANPTTIQAAIDKGANTIFTWDNLKWRARLNH